MHENQSNSEYFAPLRRLQPAFKEWANTLEEIENMMHREIEELGLPMDFDSEIHAAFQDHVRGKILALLQKVLSLLKESESDAEKDIGDIDEPRNRTIEDFKHNTFQSHRLEVVIQDIEDLEEKALYNPLHVVLGVLRQMRAHLLYYAESLSESSPSLDIQAVMRALKACIDSRQGTFGTVALQRENTKFPSTLVPATITSHVAQDQRPILHWSEEELIELMYFFIGNATRALTDTHLSHIDNSRKQSLRLEIDLNVVTYEEKTFLAIEIFNDGTGVIDLQKIRECLKELKEHVIAEYDSLHPESKLCTVAKALKLGARQVDASRIGATDLLFVRSAGKAGRQEKASGGIGLAIADRMVHEHGGAILLSNHHDGVCVTVLLPLDASGEDKRTLLAISHNLKELLRTGEKVLPHYNERVQGESDAHASAL